MKELKDMDYIDFAKEIVEEYDAIDKTVVLLIVNNTIRWKEARKDRFK